MSISRVVSYKAVENCQPWQAPRFETGGAPGLSSQKHQDNIQRQASEAGFNQGRNEGLAQGQKEISSQVASLHVLMTTLDSSLRDLDTQLVDELVELAMVVVRQTVRCELELSPGKIVGIVEEALSLLPDKSGNVQLKLHPDDAALVRDSLTGPELNMPWQIVEEPHFSRGGCHVTTSISHIDATVEARINAAIASMMGGDKQESQS